MEGVNDDLFTQALEESGAKVISQENTESTTEQEQQSAPTEAVSTETTESTTEQPSSETQETGEQTEETGEQTTEDGNPTQEAGETETKSGFVDLNAEEQPQDTPEEAPEVNSETQFNVSETFGEGYETMEDVQQDLSYLRDLIAQVEELEQREPTYANDFIKQMNEHALKGGDPVAFAQIQGMNIDEMSAKDALKLDLQQQYGLSADEAELRIRNQYTTEDWDSEDGIDPKSIDLKMDAKAAKDRLKAKQADNTLIKQDDAPSGISEEEWQARQDEAFADAEEADNVRMWDENTGWAPEVDNAIEELKSNGIIVDLGGGKGFNYVFDKDDNYTQELISSVDQALYDSGTSREENPGLAKQIMNDIFWLDNKADILKSFGDQVRSMKDEEYHRAYNNPSAVNRGDQIEKGEQQVKSVEEQMKHIWSQ